MLLFTITKIVKITYLARKQIKQLVYTEKRQQIKQKFHIANILNKFVYFFYKMLTSLHL